MNAGWASVVSWPAAEFTGQLNASWWAGAAAAGAPAEQSRVCLGGGTVDHTCVTTLTVSPSRLTTRRSVPVAASGLVPECRYKKN